MTLPRAIRALASNRTTSSTADGSGVDHPPVVNRGGPGWSVRDATRRALAIIGLATCALLLFATGASAGDGSTSMVRYWAHYTLMADGSMRVDLDFDYQLPSSGGHGPLLRIPVQVATNDPKTDRLYPLSNVTASSPSGAPAGVRTVSQHGVTTIYVGDPTQEVTGVQTYHVSYTQRGVINHFDDHDEFYWNVLADGDLDVSNISAVVTAPAHAFEVSCYQGEFGTDKACAESVMTTTEGQQPSLNRNGWDSASAGDAAFYETNTWAHDYLTIEASYPAGTFPNSPVLTADPHERTKYVFEWNHTTICITIGAGAVWLTLLLIFVTRPLRRDALMPGDQMLGAVPYEGLATRTTPPDGLHAGEVSAFLTHKPGPNDVSAMLLDLARRGAISIDKRARAHRDQSELDIVLELSGPAWCFTKTGAPVEVTAAEQVLLDGVFDQYSSSIWLDELGVLPDLTEKVGMQTLRDVSKRGWFKASLLPAYTRYRLVAAIIVYAVVSFVGGAVVATGWVLPWFCATGGILVALVLVAWFMTPPGRTVEGMALYQQTKAYETYLMAVSDGEMPPPRDSETAAAWATAFGLADDFVDVAKPASKADRHSYAYPWWLFATVGVAQVQQASQPQSSAGSGHSSYSSTSGSSGYSGSSGGGHSGGGGGGTGVGGW